MNTALILDTETTGFRDPRIVSISMEVIKDWKTVHEVTLIVRPDGFEIPADVTAIHGISTEYAKEVGVPISDVLTMLLLLLQQVDVTVCHNAWYDLDQVIVNEFRYARFTPRWDAPRFCTMEAMRNICQLPMMGRNSAFKAPKLQEAFFHCFGRNFEGAHNASVDRWACREIFRWLNDPEYHRQTLPPHERPQSPDVSRAGAADPTATAGAPE